MQVTTIRSLEKLFQYKADWEWLYRTDPEANYYLSWDWLIPWIVRARVKPLILVAHPNGEEHRAAAFLPLRFADKAETKNSKYRQIMAAGNRTADYTGVLCDPRYESHALPAFGRYLNKLPWDHLRLEFISMSRRRKQLFVSRFPRAEFETTEISSQPNDDGVDNYISPRALLPDDWDTYLASLGTNTRQKIRRFLRKVDDGKEFRIVPANDDTFERDLNSLLEYWELKWGPRKGSETDRMVASLRGSLKTAHKLGRLFMPVLWRGDEALGALGLMTDPVKGSLLFFVAGCRTDINNPAPGLVLHAYSIRHAIEQGMATYDFLRGNEPYKYMFSVEDHKLFSLDIRPRKSRRLKNESSRPAPAMPTWYRPPANVVAQGGASLLSGDVTVNAGNIPQLPRRS